MAPDLVLDFFPTLCNADQFFWTIFFFFFVQHRIIGQYNLYLDHLLFLFTESLFWSDPKLAFTCFFGPCTPYQYRLQGPGKWSGARQAIMTQWDRTFESLKTRPLGFTEKPSQKKFFIFYFVFVVLFCYLVHVIFLR